MGVKKSLVRGMSWKRRVRRKVVRGGMAGRTAKVVVPTKPRVTLVIAEGSMGRLRVGATGGVRMVWLGRFLRITVD